VRHDQAFLKRLGAIAKLVGYKLDDDVVELYDKALAPVGYQRLCDGLEKLALDLGPGKAFPSIRAIQEAATGERRQEPAKLAEDSGRIAAALVIEAVHKYGSIAGDGPNSMAKLEKVKAHVGELGWESIRAFGNWNSLCELLTYDNMATVSAQLREHARALVARKAAGIDGPPTLDSGSPQPRIGDGSGLAVVDIAGSMRDLAKAKP
jgi:hypothetical protein